MLGVYILTGIPKGQVLVKQVLKSKRTGRMNATALQLLLCHNHHGRYGSTEQAPRELDKARRAVAREELDVLVYPDIGMDPLTYLMAFARLAPVQVRCLHERGLVVPLVKNARAVRT